MRFVALISAIAATLMAVPSAASKQPERAQTAQEVAAALQAKYDQIRDFTADFTQQYESSVLRRKLTERGKVQVKKPGKMRWDYTAPEKKLFVSDGSRIYLWVPADNQVTASDVPKQDEATTAVLFLVGKGNLTRDFKVSFSPGAPAGTHALRLEPRLPERDYDWLQIVIDQKTLQIRSLTAADRQGGQSTFELSNLKENVGIPDKVFTFKIPAGADVRDSSSSAR
jgi:outer membrane lipoprotein carrier protein